jgi:hypothetical protein
LCLSRACNLSLIRRCGRRRPKRIEPILQAEAAAQRLDARILSVGRRRDGKKKGCSESARCA